MRIVGITRESSVAAVQESGVDSGPTVEVLLEEIQGDRQVTVTRVVVPPGDGMREHDHGDAEALIVAVSGEVVMSSGARRAAIPAGVVVRLDRGERVQLENRSSEPFAMVMVFTSEAGSSVAASASTMRAEPTEAADDSEWVLAGPEDQLDDESAVHVDVGGHPVCIARSGGLVYAMLDECSHGQVELSEGEVEGGYVECWLHGSRFDLSTGRPTGPPATRPVPVYPVRVSLAGIEVFVPRTPGGG